ncbi:MAG: DUF4238 domain-containing protein [Acidovorax sp.]|uniref:DUF4238 domain-containing protein n=1 Tax=Acidovorax sp. TaxID=1872122 RepID=UPI002631B19F|nr:DUF4238 domain-containing protein [Acidovorax sp.]MDH4416203.1 DUF4238 domain-containing protein [Acidovorax sp.]
MTDSRNHHFIPQGYLRGFGWKRGKHHMVIVHDFNDKKTYEANTRNVCAQRDFMRFEFNDRAPDWLETEFGKLESRSVTAIREVVSSGIFDGENKDYILNLMALLAVRSPEQRENIREFQARVAQRMMDLVLSKKEHWESQMEEMKEKTGKSSLVTYEEAKNFHMRGEYKIEVARERHIQTEIGLHHTVLQLLGQRKWTLYIVSGDYGEFITTNRPVVIAYINPESVPLLLRHSPGFGLKNTEIYFPLTSRALLIGRWTGNEATVNPANQPFIGVMNNQMIQHSYGLAISSCRTVLYHDPLLRLRYDDQLINRFTTPPSAEEIAQFKASHGIADISEASQAD